MSYLILTITATLMMFFGESPTQEPITEPPTAKAVIDDIIRHTECGRLVDHLASSLDEGTNDIIKEGDPETPVTGVITTMFATMEVLEEAVQRNCNLIIAHEPLYYNHFDQKEPFQEDSVFLRKQKYILDHGLVVWRFHDYIHCLKPDGVLAGMVEQLGWQDQVINPELNQFAFEDTQLEDLLQHLKEVFPGNAFYVIGDPKMPVRRVELAPGASGAARHFSILRKPEVDLLIAGEVPQWETYEYVRDAHTIGMNKAVVFIGHVNSEESGMVYAAKWMKGFIKDLPVSFVESKAPYWSY